MLNKGKKLVNTNTGLGRQNFFSKEIYLVTLNPDAIWNTCGIVTFSD